jgi:hypothetical protein
MSKVPSGGSAARPAVARPLTPTPAPPRPGWFDYLLILAGAALSLLLTDLSGYRALPTADTPAALAGVALRSVPHLLFLPLGLILLWPLFYMTQRMRGRAEGLTAAEWLWGVAWLGAVALAAWICWQHWGTPPEFLAPASFKGPAYVGYAVAMLALGAVGLLLGLADLVGRWPRPWTHPFCLALVMWPALPLAVVFLANIELK